MAGQGSYSQGQGDAGTDNTYIAIGVMIAVYYGAIFLYQYFRIPINTILFAIYKAELYVFQWIPDSTAKNLYDNFGWENPQNYMSEQLAQLSTLVGNYIRWPAAIFLTYLAIRSWFNHGVADQYRRRINLDSLLIESVKNFPCLTPIVGRNVLDEPLDSGPWRVARTHLQYAMENHLIITSKGKRPKKSLFISEKTGMANPQSPVLTVRGKGFQFDSRAADILFKKQIGQPMKKFSNLSDYQVGLIGAFMAFGSGNKKDGQGMLDQMSKTFIEGVGTEGMEIDTSGAQELIKKYCKDERMLQATKIHRSFVNVFILSLYKFAKQKGVISSSQFIWLRPTDRTLWYTLNQEGGREPWSEAAMPFIHFKLEEMMGNTLQDIDTDIAISNYIKKLAAGGWIEDLGKR